MRKKKRKKDYLEFYNGEPKRVQTFEQYEVK